MEKRVFAAAAFTGLRVVSFQKSEKNEGLLWYN